MPENIFYITFTGIYFIIWLILFYLRKDLRGEMLWLGIVFGVAGVFSELIFIVDWWQPPTITGTRIGVEDFLIGFFMGGVLGVVYEILGKKRLVKLSRKESSLDAFPHWLSLGVFSVVFFLSFYLFNVHSFYASLIAFSIFVLYIVSVRRDLIRNSLASGALSVFIGTVVYFLLDFLFPNFIIKFWYLPDLWFSKIILGIPLAEYIWYFFAGTFIGPLYEYLKYKKLRNVG